MHRVYNSAFMNMMRDEDNAKYRSVIKNTIEFDPDILKRYVNFMSNPDERTAIDQFGNGDKFFGVSTMMSTLPGLPMFGHGQIEGFTEKYGMEFRRARHQEDPDQGLVARHEREIGPLLHQRWLFAESENFLLYDFYQPDGTVNEDVFAYSNRRGEHRALIIYHNKFATTYGTIHQSAAYADKGAGHLRQQSLGGAFGLPNDSNLFLAFRDNSTGLEHLERASKIVSNGYSIELQAYKCHVFLHWRELRPADQYRWDLLCDFLGGRGVPNLDDALVTLELAPLHDTLVTLLHPDLVMELASVSEPLPACGQEERESTPAAQLMQRIEALSWRFANEAFAIYGRKTGTTVQVSEKDLWLVVCRQVHAVKNLANLEAEFSKPWSREARMILPSASSELHPSAVWGPVLGFALLQGLAEAFGGKNTAATGLALFDRLRLREAFARAYVGGGEITQDGWRAAARVRLAFLAQTLVPAKKAQEEVFAGLPTELWKDGDARWLLHVNESDGEEYFNKELHEQMLWWLQLPSLLELASAAPVPEPVTAGAAAEKKPRRSPVRPVGTIEEKVKQATVQAQEAGFRLAKKKEVVIKTAEEAVVKPAKKEKKALAKP
jgi:hypothetical protein